MISPLYWKMFLWKNKLWPEIRLLEQFQSLAPDVARREIARRLAAQIQYFGTRHDAFPEWKEASRIADADELWRLWPSLPVMSKRDLTARFDPHEIQQRYKLPGRVNATGGSTGEPTRFFQDHDAISAQVAATVFCKLRFGWKPGMPVIALWGSDRDLGKAPPGSWAQSSAKLRNDWAVPGFRVSGETIDRMLNLLGDKHPAAIFGYSSILEYVARQLLRRDTPVPPGWVRTGWNGGEMLFDSQVNLFRQAFHAPLHNLYGGREVSAIAYQQEIGGPLLVLRPHMFLEIVDQRNQWAAPGESGRILLTTTVGHGTPFLRYEIGDMAVAGAVHQDESGIRALQYIEGRNSGLLRLPNGTTINCIYWNHTFKEFSEIHQFQVVVHGEESIELRFTGEGMSPDREASLRRMLNMVLGGVPLTIQWLDRIPVTREGKLVQVVHE